VLSADLEKFFTEFLTWENHPDVKSIDSTFNTRLEWFESFCGTNPGMIRNDVTKCEDAIEYATHWKKLLIMELRVSLIDSIS